MSLGKRGRPPMKRTTSMTEFILDPVNGGPERAYPPLDPHHKTFNGGFSGSAAASPRAHRRNSADFIEAGIHFLRVCSLCKRRLIPGHDIYMYRGDSAFCSLECRQHQMTQDERREKYSLVSKKEVATSATVTQISAAGETVAAGV